MKITITKIEGSRFCKIKNNSKNIIPSINLKPGEEKEITISLAKLLFGDWDNSTHAEKQRQIANNIHLFEVEILAELPQISTINEKDEQIVEKRVVEPEFPGLNDAENVYKGVEVEKCSATTKAGKPCKALAVKDGFCLVHATK